MKGLRLSLLALALFSWIVRAAEVTLVCIFESRTNRASTDRMLRISKMTTHNNALACTAKPHGEVLLILSSSSPSLTREEIVTPQ